MLLSSFRGYSSFLSWVVTGLYPGIAGYLEDGGVNSRTQVAAILEV